MWKAPGSPVRIKNIQIILVFSLSCNVLLFLAICYAPSSSLQPPPTTPPPLEEYERAYDYVSSRRVLFVGGVPRSGTTLARAMLNAHPEVYCGEETRVIPRVLDMRAKSIMIPFEHSRLQAAGISDDLLDKSLGAFVAEIMLGHAPTPSPYMCNKDSLVFRRMDDVTSLFPGAKFVLLLRDGRAVAHSIVSHNVTVLGMDQGSYLSAAKYWNMAVARMVGDCLEIGEEYCLIIYYEHLVQDPRTWMEKILEFGRIPWHDNVLHHHELMGREVPLSMTETSTSQVKEPVNTAAVNKWRSKIPLETQRTIYEECDMLERLGYQPV